MLAAKMTAMREDTDELRLELSQMLGATKKYWDSHRITGAPQRFLSKFLKVRLTEQLQEQEALLAEDQDHPWGERLLGNAVSLARLTSGEGEKREAQQKEKKDAKEEAREEEKDAKEKDEGAKDGKRQRGSDLSTAKGLISGGQATTHH